MEKKRRRSLHNILTMAFTFAMVLVFAGLVGKVEVNAEATCLVTVNVKDEQGKTIDDATVVFYDDYYDPAEILQTTKNNDGTYSVQWDDSYGYMFYKYYASADGYKNSKPMSVCFEDKKSSIPLADIILERYTPTDRLQEEITESENAIKDYLNQDDYDPDQQAQINAIISRYIAKIYGIDVDENETDDSVDSKITILKGIVADAKAELDTVYTSQEIVNEDNANDISFIPADRSEPKSLKRKQYGKFGITLSYFEKGGKFQVTDENGEVINDADVTWNAKGTVPGQNFGQSITDFEFIDDKFNTSEFLYSNWLNGAQKGIITADIPNCSVTYTKKGKSITVTFDLNVIARNININILAPKKVELTRDKDTLAYNVEVAPGDGESQYLAEVQSDDKGYVYDGNITIISLNTDIATVDKNTIIPLKAGTAYFEASAEGCVPVKFEINFVKSNEEVKEDAALEAFDKLIASIGNVTLDKETAVQNARDAYDKLSENAKKRLDPATFNILTKAEATITALKTEAINKAEELKKSQEAASATTEAPAAAPTVQLSKIALKAKAAKGKVKLTWKKSSKADGYIIYRATKKNGKYKQIKVIKSWKKTTFTDKKVKSKKTYYYKICPYKGTVNGPVSAAKKAKVK